jgi:hypothetical protein
MSFKFRMYLADGEDLDDYTSSEPNWSPGDVLRRRKARIPDHEDHLARRARRIGLRRDLRGRRAETAAVDPRWGIAQTHIRTFPRGQHGSSRASVACVAAPNGHASRRYVAPDAPSPRWTAPGPAPLIGREATLAA